MTDVTITTDGTKVRLSAPYLHAFPARAKEIGGKWEAAAKEWVFDARDRDRVIALAAEFWGYAEDTDGRTVTVRVRADDLRTGYRQDDGEIRFAGRRVAWRPGRDADVRLAEGVVIAAGRFDGYGGSTRYPDIGTSDVILEIRDLPASALAVTGSVPHEIMEQGVDVDALRAERDRLTARLAEINTLLDGN